MMRVKTEFIVFHCSATPPDWNIGAAEIKHLHTASKDTPVQWGSYELRGKAWSDIGYHIVIPRNGIVELGRDLDKVGAHVKGFNRISVGVCMVGGVSAGDDPVAEDNYTDEQWRAADFLVPLLQSKYPDAELLGHRDLSPDLDGDGVIKSHEWTKQCPSIDIRQRYAQR